MKKKICIGALAFAALLCIGFFAVRTLIYSAKTDIPKLYFTGNIDEMYEKKDVRDIQVEYYNDGLVFSGFAELKVQGTSSLRYDKKNYTITFFTDEKHDEKFFVNVGWGEQSKYCLKANWIDKTHARNVVTAKLVSQMQDAYGLLTQAPRNGAVDGFPIEIYENGKFLGIYTWNIPKDAWQFGMDEENPNHIVICGEGWDDANLFLDMPDFETWSVEVGEESDATLEAMNRLFDFVMNSSDEEFKENIGEYLNLDALLNYYIMAEYAYLADNHGKNMLLATYDGLVWYPSLYDMDTSWGGHWTGESLYPYEEGLLVINSSKLFLRVEQNFSRELAERYFELRKTVLDEKHVMDEFNAFGYAIPKMSYVKETLRWGFDIPGYGYDQIQNYLDVMVDSLDAKFLGWLD